ncbi:hypothetical protein GCM10011533_07830 [Streptosporangium jomthongense]|uniref:Wzz/FepE/Etk N-terminal domain-containing protein n=1 Tax=Marinobacter aromaticivorans TaxID=1494078 RepID=A0ABW2IRR2_9GAMM|nr:Wzz/FepE/Etk N-terminal domain-containing protein [Marinobacter aromaticivorans]GGE57748.1 hypothetical protein GCM10011533_07830 [Streptosporangium jomthongense]
MDHRQPPLPDSQRPEYSDEINLVDLVATFIRRRMVFYVVFAFVTLAGLAYALLAEAEYEYVSLIQIAQKDNGSYFQSPETTVATLENRWLPEVKTAYYANHDKNLPFEVSFSNPESTGLIRFTTSAPDEANEDVSAAHSALIKGVKDHQGALVESEKLSLERQIKSLEDVLETLKGKDAGEAIASAIERRSNLEGKLERLQNLEVLVTSRQSAHKIAPKRVLIVVLAIMLGGMLGVFLAFMSEFAASVKSHIANEAEEQG